MDTTSIRRAGALLELARAHLPRPVRSSGEFDDWNVVGPGFIAIAASILEGIFQSPPPRHLLKAEILFRSLTDYVITFAWLAAPATDEERSARLRQFVGSEYRWRERAENRLTKGLADHPSGRYRGLMEEGRIPDSLLDPTTKDAISGWRESGADEMPDMLRRAFEADGRWASELTLVARSPFALLHFLGFAHYSAITHASPTAVDRVVTSRPPDLVVGEAAGLGESLGPYGNACSTFALMFLIANRTLGWPDEASIMKAAATGTTPEG
jgi:hypothetical protein